MGSNWEFDLGKDRILYPQQSLDRRGLIQLNHVWKLEKETQQNGTENRLGQPIALQKALKSIQKLPVEKW